MLAPQVASPPPTTHLSCSSPCEEEYPLLPALSSDSSLLLEALQELCPPSPTGRLASGGSGGGSARSMNMPGPAVVTGADNWSPFAAMQHDPQQQGAGSPKAPLAATPRGGAEGGASPWGPPPGYVVTTSSPIAASPARQQLAGRGRRGGNAGEAMAESGSGRKNSEAARDSSMVSPFSLKQESVAEDNPAGLQEAGPSGALRMALRRRSSSGTGVTAGRRASATAPATAGSGGTESLWDGDADLADLLDTPEEDDEDESDDEASPKAAPKKRVGRPLKYKGDPNAPHLTEEERRRIKRRIANRESARRVRQKRMELMDELQSKCTALSQQNARLLAHAAGLEQHNRALTSQVGLLRDKFAAKVGENMQLYNALVQAKRLLSQLQGQSSGDLRDSLPSPGPTGPGGGGGGSGMPSPSAAGPSGGAYHHHHQQQQHVHLSLGGLLSGAQVQDMQAQDSNAATLASVFVQQQAQQALGGGGLHAPTPSSATPPFLLSILDPSNNGAPSGSAPAPLGAGGGPSMTPPLLPVAPPVTSAADPALSLPLSGPKLAFSSSSSSLQLLDLMTLDLPPLCGPAPPQPHLALKHEAGDDGRAEATFAFL